MTREPLRSPEPHESTAVESPVVLFLCTGNSARSQMAEAFLARHGGDRFNAQSAGLEPSGINPLTVEAMTEVGIDMSGYRSKSLTEFLGKVAVRFVIVVCEHAEQHCPKIWPFGGEVISWPFEDPAASAGTHEKRLEKFRDIRDQIEARILEWLGRRA